MSARLYLDTSIPSAYFDFTKPLRQLITQRWFKYESTGYKLYISVVSVEEIEKTRDEQLKNNIKKLLVGHGVELLIFTDDARELANKYLSGGAIPVNEVEDAYHIAIATVHKLDGLASWNFRHIVNLNSIHKIHSINQRENYRLIEIGSLELFGGSKYGNL